MTTTHVTLSELRLRGACGHIGTCADVDGGGVRWSLERRILLASEAAANSKDSSDEAAYVALGTLFVYWQMLLV